MDFVKEVTSGNRLALSRLLTHIENRTPTGRDALRDLFAHTGRAHLIGVTGAPGTGKSSLVNQVARYYRTHPDPETGAENRVAIVAVDPSSPFSGGAVLGDRIRMRDLSGDPNVFIRSMASRGSLGGLASATAGMVQAFDAAGFNLILVETVGAGQAEVDIARLAHTTLVVEAPGLGDDIQAIKAGILEIADVLVVNKADRPGVENTERALRNNLKLAHPIERVFRHHGRVLSDERGTEPPAGPESTTGIWIPPIVRTISTDDGTGIETLVQAITRHQAHLTKTGDLTRRERARLQNELDLRIQQALVNRWENNLQDGVYEEILTKVVARDLSPGEAVEQLINKI